MRRIPQIVGTHILHIFVDVQMAGYGVEMLAVGLDCLVFCTIGALGQKETLKALRCGFALIHRNFSEFCHNLSASWFIEFLPETREITKTKKA